MAYKILEKEELAPGIKQYDIHAPRVAEKFKPGQFLVIRLHEKGERIPLTIAMADARAGSVRIVFQEMGKTTFELGAMNKGDSIMDVLGPLGVPTEIKKYGLVAGVAGGVGAAPLLPILKALKETGNRVITILGSRTKDLLIFRRELEKVSSELIITTDDGTAGEKGFVTFPLKRIIEGKNKPDAVWAIGPLIMMKNVCNVTRNDGVRTFVSLNPIMLDGTGMCGCCRVTVGGHVKFSCVDGPEFDGLMVDFDEIIVRNRRFLEQERISYEKYKNSL
ncbi:ferredoxin-NADP reductase [Candidatus Desantisbacteria bacterium CG_4_9_14_3_um_filter_50_7]|nr:MAG: ferredoxin-NADP reductase [Candidatus Desantisbacteria bacterium CG_4_9_14_3_um_filter_50_7]